jgi:hypothetical protein
MALDPKRRFYLDGYGQHPEWYTWHYEMLKKLVDVNTSINNQTTQGLSFSPTATDAFGRLRTSEPFTLFDSNSRYSKNTSFVYAIAGTASVAYNPSQGCNDLRITAGGTGSITAETLRTFAYQPGKSLLALNTFVFNASEPNLIQKVGYYGDQNGLYLQYDDAVLSFVKRTNISGVVAETIISQANWNADKLDGTGPSGITLDPTKAQILWMDIEWLGVGSVRMGFVIDGAFILCHTFHHANIVTSTYMTTASLPVRYEVQTLASLPTDVLMKQICSSVISEGGYEHRGVQFSAGLDLASFKTFAAVNTFYPAVALRLRSVTPDAIAVLSNISLVGLGNSKYYKWQLKRKASTSGGSWNTLSTDSVVEYNVTPTASSGGEVIASGYLSSSNQGSPVVNLQKNSIFDLQFERYNISPTFVAYEYVLEVATSSTSGGEGVYASMDWQEIVR